MKKLIPFFFLVLSWLPAVHADNSPTDSTWYPFALAEHLDPDSPANMGKQVLEAPAGKHGFVKARNGHFEFEDGTPIRFWGTNLCFNANFPDKKQAELMADRLAFFGFNAVRLHHMDFFFAFKGIFEDVAPAFADPQLKKTGTLNRQQLDRLDYLIFQLKKRGIYVDINLLVSRRFTQADGLHDAEKFGIAAKPVSMFDPHLIDLQKKYAKDLLTHVNPYTKLRYSDDPTIALIEITNENSIIGAWPGNTLNLDATGQTPNVLPAYYTTMLDQRWNRWLEKKYGTVTNLKTTWGLNQPSSGASAPVNLLPGIWNTEAKGGVAVTKTTSNEQTILTVEHPTATCWHAQYHVTGVSLVKGKTYELTFKASADRPLTIGAAAQQATPSWENLGLFQAIQLTTTPKIYQIHFTAVSDCANTKVAFIIGYAAGKIAIASTSLTEMTTAPELKQEQQLADFRFTRPLFSLLTVYPPAEQQDIRQFYTDLEKEYLEGMKTFLNVTCGVKNPVTGIGGYSPDYMETHTGMDFVDVHAYWDHPWFPHHSWDANDFMIRNTSLIQDKNLGFINDLVASGKTVKGNGKPFTVTEWNHCYPNRYAYETPVLLAAKAHEHDWNGLFEFAFSHGWEAIPEVDNIQSYFDGLANPQKLILSAIGSYLFVTNKADVTTTLDNGVFTLHSPFIEGVAGAIRARPLTLGPLGLTTVKDGAVFLLAADQKPLKESARLILVALGDVKNSSSGWSNNHFVWGQGPTQLEDVGLQINAGHNTGWKFYELTATGSSGKEIAGGKTTSPWTECLPN